MKKFLRPLSLILVWLGLLWSCSTVQSTKPVFLNQTQWKKSPTVLMISIDGFRNDYLEKYQPPTLSRWAAQGVHATGMTPSFPSLTFPNHVTLVTGLAPGHHGIVSNNFYDVKKKSAYQMMDARTVNDSAWYSAEPIWSVAEKAGMLSGTCFWVGAEAHIGGVDPTYLRRYDGNLSNTARVQQVIQWLKLPEDSRPHFLTLYFSDVDSMGHKHGPDSEAVQKAVLDVDKALAELDEWIQLNKIDLQILTVSDHGMKKVESFVDISEWVDFRQVQAFEGGATTLLYSQNSQALEQAYVDLKKHEKGFKVYKPAELPDRWKYDFKSRIGDLILVADPGVYLTRKDGFGGTKSWVSKGTHGWDPAITPEMRALFIAKGSLFKKNLQIQSFENIHVYPFVLKILGLQNEKPVDGRVEVLAPILL